MDLLRIFTVFKRHWVLGIAGLSLAAIAVLAVSYRIQPDEHGAGPSLQSRSFTSYTVGMQLMVVDARFNVGRAGRPEDRTWDAYSTTMLLAKTYAELLTSDMVRAAAEEKVGPLEGAATAKNLEQSPLIELTLSGDDPVRLRKEGAALAAGLSGYLKSQQDEHDIPEADRITLTVVSRGDVPAVEQSRDWEVALIAFLVPLAGAAGLALLLDSEKADRLGDAADGSQDD